MQIPLHILLTKTDCQGKQEIVKQNITLQCLL